MWQKNNFEKQICSRQNGPDMICFIPEGVQIGDDRNRIFRPETKKEVKSGLGSSGTGMQFQDSGSGLTGTPF